MDIIILLFLVQNFQLRAFVPSVLDLHYRRRVTLHQMGTQVMGQDIKVCNQELNQPVTVELEIQLLLKRINIFKRPMYTKFVLFLSVQRATISSLSKQVLVF